jgi:hypothetical protein
MVTFRTNFWLKFSLVNLLLVATLGVLMRYKIGFDFPFFSQKHIQHAHSHFAFSGWVTHSLYVLMIAFLTKKIPSLSTQNYTRIILVNLVCSYGMLISFFIFGYNASSIFFSTLTIVMACFFAYSFFQDLQKMDSLDPSRPWFKAALRFNIVSCLGTFYLAYMMASRNFNEHWYLASIYYYLHFQYNGFFIFACFGLLISQCAHFLPMFKYDRSVFTLSFVSVIPAYFLSVLWADLPLWLNIAVAIAAFMQLYAWIKFIWAIKRAAYLGSTLTTFQRNMFIFVGLAFSIKLLLQLGSTIPALSDLAFGFRPIVIAYLHLVLLAVISVFILTYFYTFGFLHVNKLAQQALTLFVVGVFLNELVLAVQGIAAFGYVPVKFANEILFAVALILLIGAGLMVIAQRKKIVESE